MYLSRIWVAEGCPGSGLTMSSFSIFGALVQRIEGDRARGDVAAVMAGPARHTLDSPEVRAIDGGHHLDHPARGPLWRRVDHPVHLVGAGIGMTIRTIEAQVVRDDPHGAKEIVDAQVLEPGRDVLEGFSRCLPFDDHRMAGLVPRPAQPTRNHPPTRPPFQRPQGSTRASCCLPPSEYAQSHTVSKTRVPGASSVRSPEVIYTCARRMRQIFVGDVSPAKQNAECTMRQCTLRSAARDTHRRS